MELYEAFGRLVQDARKKQGLTQTELAIRLKVSQVTIHRIESGTQNISFHRALEIAKTLEIPLDRLSEVHDLDKFEKAVSSAPEALQRYLRSLVKKHS